MPQLPQEDAALQYDVDIAQGMLNLVSIGEFTLVGGRALLWVIIEIGRRRGIEPRPGCTGRALRRFRRPRRT
ncbi:MAG TPA: hypothetical protein VM243_08380 [Phycisphaerae bacterium]|nr:hypothetical protein [Phycisphaerae bacterium]